MGCINLLDMREISDPGWEPVDCAVTHHQSPEALEPSDLIRDFGEALTKRRVG